MRGGTRCCPGSGGGGWVGFCLRTPSSSHKLFRCSRLSFNTNLDCTLFKCNRHVASSHSIHLFIWTLFSAAIADDGSHATSAACVASNSVMTPFIVHLTWRHAPQPVYALTVSVTRPPIIGAPVTTHTSCSRRFTAHPSLRQRSLVVPPRDRSAT